MWPRRNRHGPSLEITGGYELRDDRSTSGHYTFARVETEYQIGGTSVSLGYWVNRSDDDFANDVSTFFFFSLRREFH